LASKIKAPYKLYRVLKRKKKAEKSAKTSVALYQTV